MKQKIILTLSTLALALPLGACPNSKNVKLVEESYAKKISAEQSAEIVRKSRIEGYKAVKAILDVYVSHLPGKLETMVSQNYLPSKQEFINNVEKSALDKTIRNIEVIVETAIFAEDKFSVTYDWNRTYMAKGGGYSKDTGTTNFVFVKEPDGWRLLQMSGSDIF